MGPDCRRGYIGRRGGAQAPAGLRVQQSAWVQYLPLGVLLGAALDQLAQHIATFSWAGLQALAAQQEGQHA